MSGKRYCNGFGKTVLSDLHVKPRPLEAEVIAPMLDQSARVTGEVASELSLDAGYFDDEVIDVTLARDISLLCPEGQWPVNTKEDGLYHKSAFSYDAATDTYRCPAGQSLILFFRCTGTLRTRAHSVYAASGCMDCKLRANCTKAAQGRRIKRYPEDEQREALRLVMQHRHARRIFSQRKAIECFMFYAALLTEILFNLLAAELSR
jgi:Transposase DDE domain